MILKGQNSTLKSINTTLYETIKEDVNSVLLYYPTA